MAEWLKQSGFFGTHATIGADLSQLMATLFTGLFIIGWVQAKRREGHAHHWLMLGGMTAARLFVSIISSAIVSVIEGKRGLGGSEARYRQVFIPLRRSYHLVVIGLVMASMSGLFPHQIVRRTSVL